MAVIGCEEYSYEFAGGGKVFFRAPTSSEEMAYERAKAEVDMHGRFVDPGSVKSRVQHFDLLMTRAEDLEVRMKDGSLVPADKQNIPVISKTVAVAAVFDVPHAYREMMNRILSPDEKAEPVAEEAGADAPGPLAESSTTTGGSSERT